MGVQKVITWSVGLALGQWFCLERKWLDGR